MNNSKINRKESSSLREWTPMLYMSFRNLILKSNKQWKISSQEKWKDKHNTKIDLETKQETSMICLETIEIVF